MANQRKHRSGEIEAIFFDKLPPRCKEMFFEFLSCDFPYDGNKAFFIDVGQLYNEECESPIEQIFSLAYEIISFVSPPTEYSMNLICQHDISANGNKYRVDFCFDPSYFEEGYDKPFKLVIECDGHDFHERTKAQVVKGNKRDYDLKMAGYDVLHFSGSQIFNEPFQCAKETYDYILEKLK